ncbi:hypothetical protein [Oryzifoliimicrobium ureilyticus]|uniref:hypothetical protein n=1 Tax=Oryzifoliimicrobium ureilyticus TaxID=3113724 RepID=UPI0030763D97
MTTSLIVALPSLAAQTQIAPAKSKSIAAPSEASVRDWLTSLGQDGAQVTNAGISSDANTDTVTVSNLVVAEPSQAQAASGASIRIEKLVLTAFSGDQDGYRFSQADASNVSVSADGGGSKLLDLSRLTVGKSFIPKLSEFKPDAQKPVTSQIRFLSLLSKASINEATASKLSIGSDLKADTAVIGVVANGAVSKITLTNLSGSASTAEEAGTQSSDGFNVAELSLSNVDLGAYIKLFDESAYLAAGTNKAWNSFIGAVSVKGLSVQDSGSSFGLDQLQLGAMKVRQFPENITPIFDNVARDPTYLQKNPADAERVTSYIQQSFSFEKAEASKFVANIASGNDKTRVEISAAALSNLTATHVDHLEFSAAKAEGAGGKFNLRTIRLDDVNLVPGTTEGSATTEPVRRSIPTVAHISAEGIDAQVAGAAIGLERLDLDMSYFIGAVPTNIKSSVQHVKFAVAQIADPGLRQTLTDLGYQNVDLSLELSAAWQDAVSAIAFDTVKISGVDMGTLNLSGSITGITRKSMEDPTNVLGQEVAAGGVRNFRLSFENASLFDRVLGQMAKANNKTPEELKSILSTNMPAIMGQIPSPTIRNKFVFAAISFINAPRIIELISTSGDVTPIKDVIASTSNPYQIPLVLKLDASANERK